MTSDGGESAGLDLGAFVEGLFVIHTHAPARERRPPAGRTVVLTAADRCRALLRAVAGAGAVTADALRGRRRARGPRARRGSGT
ncbi:hypothetical protein ADK34_40105 [Streptomyces viridochromogenes]|uniref:Uncharacterized protein n=1 Tax=Streptomyces viridochromogenes TaxID=1938 RepID=A0A0L8J182_STRVR|nr:hypothetical protein ADK34_40105 [Streptomyces viridochromogenes]